MNGSENLFRATSSTNVVEAVFLKRINRFLVECELESALVRAFLPNPGRLWELLFPGVSVMLSVDPPSCTRNTAYTLLGINNNGNMIMLHTHAANHAVRWLLDNKNIPYLRDYHVKRQEYSIGQSRFDFLLRNEDNEMLLEVKSCSLFGKRIAMFPDAPSTRAARHVRELGELVETGHRGSVLFLVQSSSPDFFLPDFHTDPLFSEILYQNRHTIDIKAISVSWDEKMFLSKQVSELEIPWYIYESDSGNKGCYMVILKLKNDMYEKVGNLGEIHFRKGFYIYVGSAFKNMNSRIARHRSKRKRMYWHIDYLRNIADVVQIIPIRTATDLECSLAARISAVAEWKIPFFGGADCNCSSHLFGMSFDPLDNREFINALIYFRIDRLEALI